MSFFDELRRRNVIRTTTAYAVTGWLLIQVSETVLPVFGFGDFGLRVIIVVLAVGLVPVAVLTWAFEWTPEGLKRDRDLDGGLSRDVTAEKRLNRIIMVMLALALGYFAFDKFVLDPGRDAAREQRVAERARTEALLESYGDRSIAVLPFVNMSADPEQDYFSDGISEELLNLLAQITELRVISRSSSFAFRNQKLEVTQIAERLNVSHVLEGSVRRSGNQLRITAQLIDARSDTHLWSQTYDRAMGDVFAIQDEISAAVVDQLKLRLLAGPPTSRPTDPDAYTLFLQGRHFLDRFTEESLEKAGELYRQVLAIDPEYPPALKGLAEILANQAGLGLIPLEGNVSRAWDLVLRAAELDPDYADAWSGIAQMHQYYSGDLVAAAENVARAVDLGPNQATIIGDAGGFARYLGRKELAVELMERQVRLDPVSSTAQFLLARALLDSGRLEEAIAEYDAGLDLSPGQLTQWFWRGGALMLNGDYEAALESVEREKHELLRLTGRVLVHHASGHAEASDAALDELIAQTADEFWYVAIAYAHAWRGESDLAFEVLSQMEQSGVPLTGINTTPFFEPIWDDPRWEELLARHGMSRAQLDAIPFEIEFED
jgi:TolB-like protein/Flp pilus assembly protein TadD